MFGFKFKNIAPILGYPTREKIRQMEAQGLRLLERSSPEHEDGKRMLAAAKAIIAIGHGTRLNFQASLIKEREP